MKLSELTGPQRAMYLVLKVLFKWQFKEGTLDELHDPIELEVVYAKSKADHPDEFADALEVARTTFIETTLAAPPVRGFEVKAVAQLVGDDVYVGWYCLSGSADAHLFDWVNSAFPLTATIEQVVTNKYHFTLI